MPAEGPRASLMTAVVDPVRRLARVYRRDGSEVLVASDGALAGEDLLPGFSCPLASIL